jgi:hypothetical protein
MGTISNHLIGVLIMPKLLIFSWKCCLYAVSAKFINDGQPFYRHIISTDPIAGKVGKTTFQALY